MSEEAKVKSEIDRNARQAAARFSIELRAAMATPDSRAFMLRLIHSPDYGALGAIGLNELHALERNGQQKVGLRIVDALKTHCPALLRTMYEEALAKGVFP